MALNTITQIKLPSGKVIDLVDWSDQPIFSTCDLQTGFTTQDMSLFQYVVGDAVPGFGSPGAATTLRTATPNDTNIAAPGSMASTEEMLVYAIKPEVYFYVDTVNDFTTRSYTDDPGIIGTTFPTPTARGMEVLNQQLLLRLIISQKIFAEAGFGYYNRGFGVFQSNLSTIPTGVNGLPSQEAVRSFVIPHHIGAQEKYRVQLVNTSDIEQGAVVFGVYEDDGPAVLDTMMATIRIYLDGLSKRPTA